MTTQAELNAQRALTAAFIAADATAVVLIPRQTVLNAAGARVMSDGSPRVVQSFKLSLLNFDERPTFTVAGQERVIDYHMIGRWDAAMAVHDYWLDADGTKWEIVGFSTGFDYMRKAFVVHHTPPSLEVK
jgi:hypothetical protein